MRVVTYPSINYLLDTQYLYIILVFSPVWKQCRQHAMICYDVIVAFATRSVQPIVD